jgi:pilus assembly protein CpaE
MNAINSITPTRRKRIALFSGDTNLRRDIAARLDSLAIYDVHVEEAAVFLEGPKQDARPSVVILDVDDGTLLENGRLVGARGEWANIPLIALSRELTQDRIRALVRLNAADWLRKPFDNKELINAVSFHDSGSQASKSRVTTFLSASGGAGATTLALATAQHLAGKSAEAASSTCLVDLDFQHANCSSYLNLHSEFDLSGVIAQPDRLDVELMDIIKLTRNPGFTLYSFERPRLPFEANGQDFVFKLLDLAAYRFDNIVIDLPNREAPWTDTVLSSSDGIFLVFELNVASLRHAKQAYARIRELKGGDVNVTLVANKHKRKFFGNYFSRRELQKIFKIPHIRMIALDAPLLSDSVNRALLPTEVHARARFNRDVKSMLRERLDAKPR